MHYTTDSRAAGEVTVTQELAEAAAHEFLELQVLDIQAFVKRYLRIVESYSRVESLAYTPQGRLVGGCVLVVDPDEIHVGRCLTVVFNFVLPEYRGSGVVQKFYREAYRVARWLDCPIIARTRRIGDWKYETHYKRVHGKICK